MIKKALSSNGNLTPSKLSMKDVLPGITKLESYSTELLQSNMMRLLEELFDFVDSEIIEHKETFSETCNYYLGLILKKEIQIPRVLRNHASSIEEFNSQKCFSFHKHYFEALILVLMAGHNRSDKPDEIVLNAVFHLMNAYSNINNRILARQLSKLDRTRGGMNRGQRFEKLKLEALRLLSESLPAKDFLPGRIKHMYDCIETLSYARNEKEYELLAEYLSEELAKFHKKFHREITQSIEYHKIITLLTSDLKLMKWEEIEPSSFSNINTPQTKSVFLHFAQQQCQRISEEYGVSIRDKTHDQIRKAYVKITKKKILDKLLSWLKTNPTYRKQLGDKYSPGNLKKLISNNLSSWFRTEPRFQDALLGYYWEENKLNRYTKMQPKGSLHDFSDPELKKSQSIWETEWYSRHCIKNNPPSQQTLPEYSAIEKQKKDKAKRQSELQQYGVAYPIIYIEKYGIKVNQEIQEISLALGCQANGSIRCLCAWFMDASNSHSIQSLRSQFQQYIKGNAIIVLASNWDNKNAIDCHLYSNQPTPIDRFISMGIPLNAVDSTTEVSDKEQLNNVKDKKIDIFQNIVGDTQEEISPWGVDSIYQAPSLAQARNELETFFANTQNQNEGNQKIKEQYLSMVETFFTYPVKLRKAIFCKQIRLAFEYMDRCIIRKRHRTFSDRRLVLEAFKRASLTLSKKNYQMPAWPKVLAELQKCFPQNNIKRPPLPQEHSPKKKLFHDDIDNNFIWLGNLRKSVPLYEKID